MSLSAIRSITEAEEAVKKAKLDAQAKNKQDAELAEQEGRVAIAATMAQAEGEIRHLRREAEIKAEEYAVELASNTANKCAVIAAHSESVQGEAVAYIVERIVSG